MMIDIAISIVFIWLFFLLILAFAKAKRNIFALDHQPFVSILIALRNEEHNVESLCESLAGLTYPSSKFEVLLGDDDSQDATFELLQKHKPENAKAMLYKKEQTGTFGKQKVLSRLSKESKGDYLLFTDADMTFQADWIQGMLENVQHNQITVGFTRVQGDALQNMDWLFNEWVVSVCARFGIYLTAWGNNMLISKKTYEKIGGHEVLEESIVEDVFLLRKLIDLGGSLHVSINSKAVAITQSVDNFYDLLHQRKRWMTGLTGYRPLFAIGGLLKTLFWPALLVLTFNNPFWLGVVLVVLIIRWKIFYDISRLTKTRIPVLLLLLYEVYDFVFYLITFAFDLLPIRVKWKGRKY